MGALRLHRFLPHLVLAFLALAAYANTLGHDFVYDDYLWVIGNELIRSFSNLPQVFSAGHLENRVYRPLPVVSFTLDYAIAGIRPWFYHLVNVLLHAGVTLLLYRVLRPLGERVAWLAAALFAVAPVHTEVVANVTSRSELLATLLGLTALGVAQRAAPAGAAEVIRPALAGALVMLAMMGKETAVAIPALAPLLWWRAPDHPPPRQMIALSAAMAAGVCAYLVARRLAGCCVLFTAELPYADLDNPLIVAAWAGWGTRIRTALMVLGQNFAISLVPYHLSADYCYPQIPLITSWADPRWLAWTALPAGAAVLAFAARHRHPDFARGVAWFLVAVFPVSNVLLLIGTLRAERLLYLPSAGACLVMAQALALLLPADWRRKGAAAVPLAAISAIVLVLGAATIHRNRAWRNQPTILLQTAADAPRCARVHYQLGGTAGGCGEAVPRFRKAIELAPRFQNASLDLGRCLERLGDASGAEQVYREALAVRPTNRHLAEPVARLCTGRGDWGCVASAMRAFLDANPGIRDADAWLLVGYALSRQGQPQEAENAYRRALAFASLPAAHFNLAGLLASSEKFREAVQHYQAAEKAGMNSEALYVDWAVAAKRAGDEGASREAAARGLARFPDSRELKKMAR